MKFCSQCAAPVTSRIPPGDDRPRHVCDSCGTIFYSNPKIVAGCIPVWQEQLLLCRRAIEPRSGLWTLPAGFMENGESTAQAALRETLEEANARVEMGKLFAYLNIPALNQVYVIFLARLLDLDYFKDINDSHGHDVGDQLLMEVARRVLDTIRESDTLARVGPAVSVFGSARR